MRNSYKQIFYVYFRNPSFILLSLIFLLTAGGSKLLYMLGLSFFAEEISTILFVVTLWLTFHMGLLIKRQFANHRASLLPGYRKPHLYCAMVLYIIFILIAFLWDYGLKPVIPIGPQGMQGAYASCLLIALCITYVGYLSIGRTLLYAYFVLLILATQLMNIISLLESAHYLKYLIVSLSFLFILMFRKRLLQLKEEDFEYGYLFSWPPHRNIYNQLKANEFGAGIFNSVKKILHVKDKNISIPKYSKERNIFVRAYHWDYTEHADIKIVIVTIILMVPIFFMFIKTQPSVEGFFRNAYSNFLLLAITPVVAAIGSHYKRLAYWGYDLLKPVKKNEYIKERGLILLAHLFLYWIVFCVCFAVVPSIIYQPEVFALQKFWGFIISTGIFSFMVFNWLSFLSCKSSLRVVIFNGIILSSIVLFQFYLAPKFSFGTIISISIVCLSLGFIFLKKAYYLWCQKEFI
ncbi:hypothetical protein ACFL1E_05850 [Candidatus Omnitrophota bacterium]